MNFELTTKDPLIRILDLSNRRETNLKNLPSRAKEVRGSRELRTRHVPCPQPAIQRWISWKFNRIADLEVLTVPSACGNASFQKYQANNFAPGIYQVQLHGLKQNANLTPRLSQQSCRVPRTLSQLEHNGIEDDKRECGSQSCCLAGWWRITVKVKVLRVAAGQQDTREICAKPFSRKLLYTGLIAFRDHLGHSAVDMEH